MKQHPQKPERRHDRAVDQIASKVFVPGQQLADDLRHHKKRQNLKCRTDDGEDHTGDIAGLFLPGKDEDPAEGTFFFFHISRLTSKIFFMVGSSASVTEKSSRIPPPSKCSTRVQVRQTNS